MNKGMHMSRHIYNQKDLIQDFLLYIYIYIYIYI